MKPKQAQHSLFDENEGTRWQDEWQGMPEFIQEDLTPYKSLTVHFETQADVKAFEALIGQKLYPKNNWIWFPHKKIDKKDCIYISERNEP